MFVWGKKIDYKGNYHNRERRYHFCLQNFNKYLKGKILDVGCDTAYLKRLLSKYDITYVGVDKYEGSGADIFYDLERIPLPFKNKEFDVVCCLDVLEHIDNFHIVFDELARISKKYIIISLPNNFSFKERARVVIGLIPNNHYGLPIDMPMDRHKWMFNLKQVREFMHYKSKSNGFRIIKEFPFYKTEGLIGPLRVIFKKLGLFPGLFAASYWTLLERQ